MPPGSHGIVGMQVNQVGMAQRAGMPLQRPPMTPEQMALAQRPGMPMVTNQGPQANPAMMRQPGMLQQSPVVPGGQAMAANQRVCFF